MKALKIVIMLIELQIYKIIRKKYLTIQLKYFSIQSLYVYGNTI